MTKSRIDKSTESTGLHSPLSPRTALWIAGSVLLVLGTAGALKERIHGVFHPNLAASVLPDPTAARRHSPERMDASLYTPPPEYGAIVRPFESFGGRKKVILSG